MVRECFDIPVFESFLKGIPIPVLILSIEQQRCIFSYCHCHCIVESEDIDNQLSSELSQKSEMETLDDLKKATEEAIRELQKETLKVAKRKGIVYVVYV
jgi:hypothetical protein